MTEATTAIVHAWRHARADAARGYCIGRTDVPVDPRRARRLAHRIREFARRHQLPRIVVTSPLLRSRASGEWLARWGWEHRIDARLTEIDFGSWDGHAWSEVPRMEFDAWCADFDRYAPGGGENVAAVLERVRSFDPGAARIVITHGGWLSAVIWLRDAPGRRPDSACWPAAPRHGRCIMLEKKMPA